MLKNRKNMGVMCEIIPKFKNLLLKLQKFPIYVHPLFFAVGIFMVVVNRLELWIIYTLLAVYHELAHFIVAKKLGYKLQKIKLMPFGAVLEAEHDEFLFNDEIIVSLAGPLFNLLICIFFVALWWIKPEIYYNTLDIAVANLSLGLFNLVPVYPLDGGRVVLSLISKRYERERAAKIMRFVTITFAVILIFFCFLSLLVNFNLTLGLIGLMMLASSFSSSKETSYKRVLTLGEKFKKARIGLPVKEVIILKSMPVLMLYRKISASYYTKFIVVDEKMCELARLNETDVFNFVNDGLVKTEIYQACKMKKY